MNEQYAAANKRRTEITQELVEINIQLSRLNEEVKGKHLRPSRYQQLCAEQASLKRRKFFLEAEASKCKQTLREISQPNPGNPAKHKYINLPGKTLDEYDLANALVEPQRLLQLAYASLKKAVARHGTTDDDRAILESINHYLFRYGIIVDRQM